MREFWQIKTLGEILQKTETVNPVQSPNKEFDYIDVSSVCNKTFRIQSAQRLKGKNAPSRARRLVKSNDVLLATVRPTLQRIAIVPDDFDHQVCSTGYFVLRPKPEVSHRFLFYYLFTDGFQGQMERLQKGASYPAVNDGEVKSQLLSFPPLPEQKRIVAILDDAFVGISHAVANAEKNLANAREVFESYLNGVFTQGNGDWVEKKLGDVCDFLNGFAFKSNESVESSNVQLIRMGNLYQNVLDLNRRPSFYPDSYADEYAQYVLSHGDLIMSLTGTVDKEDYGFTVEIPTTDRTLLLNQRIAKFINIRKNLIERRYFLYFLRSKDFLKKLYRSARGVRQANLSSVSMKKIPVIFPRLDKQKSLVRKFDALEEDIKNLEVIYKHKLSILNELKQSILQKAFAGELTDKTVQQQVVKA